jgi:hypothetical protein
MRPRSSVVLHVGAHKTGSSLVQKFLRDNRTALSGHGIHYIPRSDMNTLIGWGRALHDEPELLRRRLEDVTTGRHPVVMGSHENTLGRPFVKGTPGLYPDGPRNAKALGQILDGFDYTVVVYIRPQADFVESYYLQSLHEGGTQTFAEWTRELIDYESLSWRPLIDALGESLGPHRVVVKDFRDIKHGQEEFLRRFFAAVEVDPKISLSYAPVRNASISEKGMQMALAVNPLVASSRQRKAVRVFLQKHFSNRRYPRPSLFTEAERSRIAELYDQEYRAWSSA